MQVGNSSGVINSSNPLAISGTVTVGNSVTIGSLPVIAGTVTANVTNSVTVGAIIGPAGGSCLKSISPSGDAVRSLLFTKDSQSTYGELSGSAPGTFNLPVYGTVTVGNSVTIGSLPAISGTVTANAILQNATAMAQAFIDESDAYGAVGVSIVNSAGNIAVVGTVTAAAPNGSLTTRFGTPTTANVSFATAAVTNSERKYLLIPIS